MLEKLNIKRIIIDQFDTFSDSEISNDGKTVCYNILLLDLFIFLILPIAISLLIIGFGFKIDSNFSILIITALSIFAGLLLNLLLIIFDMIKKSTTEVFPTLEDKKIKLTLLKQTYTNIAFCILISLLTIIAIILYNIYQYTPGNDLSSYLLSFVKSYQNLIRDSINFLSPFVIYGLLFIFIEVLLMILKRVYDLFKNDFYADEKGLDKTYKYRL